MKANGVWHIRKPVSDEIVELFVSKSSWHEHYTKLFPQAEKHKALFDWLEQGEEAPTNFDLWGVEKGLYSFKDLRELLGRLKAKKGGKKRKADSDDEESSSDDEGRKRRKRKGDSVERGSAKKSKKTSHH